MGDLISRKETEKMLRKYADEVGCNRGLYELANGILKAVSYLDNIPDAFTYTADMAENEAEAIKWMKNIKDHAVVTLDHIKNNEPNVSPVLYEGRKEKAETIIKGFEELGRYRAIGTIKDITKVVRFLSVDNDESIIDDISEVTKYRLIGTVEECQEAMGKQKAKKPTKDGYNHSCCPNCGWIVYKDEYGGRYLPCCENCGQAIDWDDRGQRHEGIYT